MKQAIAGVAPAETTEVTVMTIWPSISAYPSGRFLGRCYAINWPDVYIFRLGRLIALLSIPHALFLYFWKVAPFVGMRYTLTNRRVVVQKGMKNTESRAIELDRFDTVETVVQPGQAWFKAGDLIFKREGREVFRLEGVSWPEAFRHQCIKSHMAYVGVKAANQRRAIPA